MTIKQFLLALRGRYWIFLALMAGTIAAAVIVSLVLPKTYVSTVSLFVDNPDQQTLAGQVTDARAKIGYMQTQVDLIQSQRVAHKVAENLKLHESPDAQRAFKESGARGDIRDWIGSSLMQGLKVESTQSSVINLSYSANDSKFAAMVADAFAKAYMDVTLALRVEPNKQAANWFDEQLKGLRDSLEQAQGRLAAFQREKGIIATDERVDVENARLAELSSQSLQATNATYDSATRLGQTRSNTPKESLPEVLANPLVQTLKGEVLRGEAKLMELSTRLGPNHPQYQQQVAENQAMRSRMNAEIARVVGGVESATAQSAAREAALKRDLAAQRARVVELRDARAQASTLQRDVDTAQRAYEAALQRSIVNRVEGGARQTNVAVLSPALEPSRPAKPNVRLNIALGVIVGILLGLGAVFLLEILDRRVRSAGDLDLGAIDAPVLGTLQTWQPSQLLGGFGGARALPNPT
jgi:chain length determinant protein EpsF